MSSPTSDATAAALPSASGPVFPVQPDHVIASSQPVADQWTPQIDKIVAYLEQVKKDRKLKRYTFTAAVWVALGQELVSLGFPGFTTAELKARFTMLKSKKSTASKETSNSVSVSVSTPTAVLATPASSPSHPPPPAAIPTQFTTGKAAWCPEADFLLVSHMVGAKAQGLMSDNNFKATVYNRASESLTKGYLFTGKQCRTRWDKLKSNFKIVVALRLLSGFGWDPIRHMVTAPDAVWDSYLKGHKKATPFRTQPFPLYDDIAGIVGHTTATGAFAQSSENAILDVDLSGEEEEEEASDMEDIADCTESKEEDKSPKKKRRSARTPSTPAPKRKRTSAGANALINIDSSVSTLADHITSGSLFAPPPTDSPNKKRQAFKTVIEEEGLSPTSMAAACKVFRGSGEIAREYLSFDSSKEDQRRARHIWLLGEMDAL